MTVRYPLVLVAAVVVGAALAYGYWWLQRRRTRALAGAGLTPVNPGLRRHVPPVLFLVALVVLLVSVARPEANVGVPKPTGTVILAFDVSNSMAAEDVDPSRLAAAKTAAIEFVRAQPGTLDIGVVAFGQGALTTNLPSDDHESTVAAINRLTVAGGTSLGQAILASLTAIVGKSVALPDADSGQPPPDLGYWGSATIVLLSDGEDTGGPDAVAAAQLAATAGVHIETVGVGTVDGATVEVDGYQVSTALNEELLTQVAESTAGSYHRAGDADALTEVYRTLDLRITVQDEPTELTGFGVGLALLLLLIGGVLMINWFGRIV